MLSQKNIDKLHEKGIYRCEPVLKWLPSWKRDNPYWCKNWTFRVVKYGEKYLMYDTYWTGDEYPIELTDENFEYLFDLDAVRFVNDYSRWLEYPEEDRWHVGLDSGGDKYIVRRGAKKVKERVVERLEREINILKSEIASKENQLEGVLSGEINWNYV